MEKKSVKADLLSSGKKYRLVPLESVQLVGKLLPRHGLFHIVKNGTLRRAKARKFSEEIEKWELGKFNVSRFFRPKCGDFPV